MRFGERHGYGRLAAEVYDIDKPVGHSFGDVEFYRARLLVRGGPALEPGVGNGRLLIPLRRAGLDISGFDASPAMLAACRRNLSRHRVSAAVWRAGFEDFTVREPVAAIILPAGSFQLMTSEHAVGAFLARSHRALRPGGLLMLDLEPAAALCRQRPRLRQWSCRDGGILRLRETPAGLNRARQVVRALHVYSRIGPRGGPARACEPFVLRWWQPDQIASRLCAAGFRVIETVHGYGDPRRAGEVLTVIAARR